MDTAPNDRCDTEPHEGWQTTFDLIGLAAYFTLMTGEVPDVKLLQEARKETGPSAEVVRSGPKDAKRSTIGSSTG